MKNQASSAQAVIDFATGQCSLGGVLVAANSRGICAIFLGDDLDGLMVELQAQFPGARLRQDTAGLAHQVAQVVDFIETPSLGLPLPLDVGGTPFQLRVWQALREIPPGTTLTYTELAEQIGKPGSARAVARACATNCIAVAIPCHRVVRRDGDLAGYRWGVERKRELLRREAAAIEHGADASRRLQPTLRA